jgi:hypothetical protein
LQKQEEEEIQRLIQDKEQHQQPLKQSNQYLPAKQLSSTHQNQHLKQQVAKSRLQNTILACAFCLFIFVAIFIAFPTPPIEQYASQLAGGFPNNFGVIVGGLAFCSLLCMFLLERINPDIARRYWERVRQEREEEHRIV